ncbi:MAG: helix-turn-helix transcriptional regulator [Desulfovibrionaceae bacterium]|nr:helix-turn-helix transcriptional regulator [Desulfovibrionaceae bacterium]
MKNLFISTMNKLASSIKREGSIRQAAISLDMNPTTVSRWFSEERSPDFKLLCLLLERYGVDIVFPEDEKISPDARRVLELEHTNKVLEKKNIELQAQVDILRDMMQQQRPAPQQAQLPLPEPAKKAG